MAVRRKRNMSRHQGMALVLVLWIVAALSIFAMGLGKTVHQEAALVNVSRNMAYGRAAGEAAIFEALQRLSVQPQPVDALVVQRATFMGRSIELQIVPWSGLVNINAAPAPLLAMLLQHAGQMPPSQANSLAQALVQARESMRSGSANWDAPEDLLQVPGMGYSVFSRIREYLVAEPGGRQGINPAAAPLPLRSWLASSSTAAWQQGGASTRYTIIANVLFEGQGVVRVARQVSISQSDPGKLPWRLHAATQTWSGSM